MGTTELILYKNIEHDEILKGMERLMNQEEVKEGRKALYFDMIHKILDLSAKHGFEGNLWHTYLTFLLVNQETVFSVANELSGKVKGSINEIAFRDYGIFREFFHWDIKKLDKEFHTDCCRMIVNYRRALSDSKVFQQKVRERICQLSIKLASAKNSKRFMSIMVKFYKDFGVGKLGLHKGFRVEEREGKVELLPITSIAPVRLEDLVGYEIAKKKLIENTEAFIEGRRANNCLLFGDAGTGKTTVLSVLCSHPTIKAGGVLLLAPTGKATVRLLESMGEDSKEFTALNVAQFLVRSNRFDWNDMRYVLSDANFADVPETVIIDEASMLTEEMFGALMQALKKARRIIFVGDPNQLPPIGAGRPFVDLVYMFRLKLADSLFPKVCEHYGELTINRRQQTNGVRRDVRLSGLFTNTGDVPELQVMAIRI